MILIYTEVLIHLITLLVKGFNQELQFDFYNIIDALITFLMFNVFYCEFFIHYILRFDLNKQSNLALFKMSYLTKKCDFLLGLVYVIICIKALPKSKFTEIITHIMITFQRSLADLTGFFVVFIFFLVSYSFGLYHLFIEHIEKEMEDSTLKDYIIKEFSTLTKCFAALFRLIWGDIDFEKTTRTDWKSFYFFLSFLIFMIIIMFNLMLAIILGTYDSVKNDPTCRGAYFRMDEYILILFERHLKSNKRVYNFLLKYTNIKSKLGLFSLADIEKRLKKKFEVDQVDHLLKMYDLSRSDQIDKFKVQTLIRNMFQLDYNSKPKLRIINHYLAGDYVSDQEWKKLTNAYDNIEIFCALFERRLDVVCDALLTNLNDNEINK
jgi:hypothetical protein